MVANEQVIALINALRENRDGLRPFAMRRLVNLGAPAVPDLIAALKDPDYDVQEHAAVVLRTIGQPALPALLQTLQCNDRKLRWGAAWVLSSMGLEARDAVIRLTTKQCKPEQVQHALPAALPHPPNEGVWSDSWLTKVREQLHAARMSLRIDSVRVKHP